MSNTLTDFQLDLIATNSVDYLWRKLALVSRVHVETIQNSEMRQGVNEVKIPLPIAAFAPTDFDNATNGMASPNDITLPTATFNPFQYRKKILINMTDLESKKTRGNFDEVLKNVLSGQLDGMARYIDQQLTALYTGTALATSNNPANLLTPADVTEAVMLLEENDIPVERCTLAVNPRNWWKGLFEDQKIIYAQNYGGPSPIQSGTIPNLYGLKELVKSNNIVVTTASGGAKTAHNILFDKYAFVVGFVEYEPANKYGAPNVEEAMINYNGIPLRVHRWFDVTKAVWYMRIDVTFGVGVLDATRFVHLASKGG